MTPKQYLQQYRKAAAILKHARDELELARHDAMGIRAMVLDDMPKSRNMERDLSDAYVKIEDRLRRLNIAEDACRAIMTEVVESIRTAPNELEYEVLYARYIDGRRWDDIAERLHISRQWATTIHGRALKHIRIGGE